MTQNSERNTQPWASTVGDTNLTGAEILMRTLLDEGVSTLFGYPGGAIMPVYDALYDYRDRLNHILVRHEQAAAHAAEGYARVRGKTGVCIVTSGPGATNTITGIADAMMDSTPIVVIMGQVGAKMLGTDAFQECDVVTATTPELTYCRMQPNSFNRLYNSMVSSGSPSFDTMA